MLNAIAAGIKWWMLPSAVSQTIDIRGGTLSVTTPTHVRSLSLYRLKFHVPGEHSYGVEYRVSDDGEFHVDRGFSGGIVIRNNREKNSFVPVCWLPERFLGKKVDRYIVHVDGKRSNYRAGLMDTLRASVSGSFDQENGSSQIRHVA